VTTPPAAPSGAGLLDEAARLGVWRDHGARPAEAAELLAYAASPLHHGPAPDHRYPLPDAPCVTDWERYLAEAREEGAFAVLRRVFVQLRFPIAAGISQDPDYLAATRRGLLPDGDAAGLELARPDGLRLFLHATAAGRVPVVLAEARADFEALVQAITTRNEPVPVPLSMGACMVAGYNNWERVAARRRAFEAQHPEDWTGEGWAAAFRELVPHRELYQDRFMLLSSGHYSSTPAAALGLTDAAWSQASVRLRLEHECTHYVTRQAFGAMRKSLLDELVADYVGLREATGGFVPAHFLRFMGLEGFPRRRADGRLSNYRGDPPLSDGAFQVLPSVVKLAAENLGAVDPAPALGGFGVEEKARIITALMRVGLEGLASGRAPELLASALHAEAP
jgi:uncharacterized protein DUF7005